MDDNAPATPPDSEQRRPDPPRIVAVVAMLVLLVVSLSVWWINRDDGDGDSEASSPNTSIPTSAPTSDDPAPTDAPDVSASPTDDEDTAGHEPGGAVDEPVDPGETAAGEDAWALTEEGRTGWEPLVKKFTNAFLARQRSQKTWLAAIRPLVWGDLYKSMSSVDPARVPEGMYASYEIESSGDATVDVTVTVEAPSGDWLLGVLMQYDYADERWIVYRYEDRGEA